MILCIPDVLTPEQTAEARALLESAEWIDGKATAGHQAIQVKDNMQLPATHPVARQVGVHHRDIGIGPPDLVLPGK